MKKSKAILITPLVLILLVLVFPSQVFAAEESEHNIVEQPGVDAEDMTRLEATSTPEPEPHHHLEGAFLDWFHNPADWIEMGADERFKIIVAKNIDTLSDDLNNNRENHWNFIRQRMRWWQKFKLDEDVDFNSRLVWEFRHWDEGPTGAGQQRDKRVDFDEILFDQFNITWRNMFGTPVKGVFGRQDIILGRGWLVLDGTPLDGSRTIYFDAMRFTYDWAEKNTVFDLILIHQEAAEDAWLKPINDEDRHVTEQDENGIIFYVTNKSLEKTQFEGYFIYKNDNPIDVTAADEPVPWPSAVWSRKAEIFTFGGAVEHRFDDHWSARAEGAMQVGDKEEPFTGRMADLEAFGFVSKLDYNFNDEKKNNLHIGYEYLSGDDPDTRDYEQFDPLWGEWPQWSELYVYTYNLETMIGETTNLHRFNVGHSFKPAPNWQINTDYHALWAAENTSDQARYAYPWYNVVSNDFNTSNDSKFRGHLFTLWVKWQCCPQLRWHWLAEYFSPGSYYSQAIRDGAYFLRFNIEYTF
ncbi:MAG: hypothetical protein WC962_07260 [Phycisphaerae bacterium]|jgi:hypothetical protein